MAGIGAVQVASSGGGGGGSSTITSFLGSNTAGPMNVAQIGGNNVSTVASGIQLIGLGDSTNIASILKSDGTAAGQNALMVGGSVQSQSYSLAAAGSTATLTVAGFGYVSVHILTGFSSGNGTNFQVSNDGANWKRLLLASSDGSDFSSSPANTGLIYSGPLGGAKYFRLTISGSTGGPATGLIMVSTLPATSLGTKAAQYGTWTVGSNSATGSGVPANAFYLGAKDGSGNLVGLTVAGANGDGSGTSGPLTVGPYLFNGTNYDRTREIVNGNNTTGIGIAAVGILAQFDDVSPTSITENQFGNSRMSANRNLYVTMRDAAGNEQGLNITTRNSLLAEGPTASGNTLAANPFTIGAKGVNAEQTAVTNGQVVNFVTDLVGKQIVLPYANPENFVSGRASATDTTSTSLIAAPASGLRNYITHITVWNSSATSTYIKIQDGSGGTELYDVPAPAGGGASLTLPTPLRQPTTATALYFAANASANAIVISASGYKGA